MRVAKVIIPAACFNAEQLDAATFVFRTIRVGFPTAQIVLVIGNTAPDLRQAIIDGAKANGVEPTCNDDYATRTLFDVFEGFLKSEQQPFFFCDTDIVFWESIEARVKEFGRAAMAGRFIPKFYDKVTRSITMPRVHNCLLYVDPYRVRCEMEQYFETLGPSSVYTPRPDLIRPTFMSVRVKDRDGYPRRKSYFYDTWAMAYNALPGVVAFSDAIDACFDHLNCGSVAHTVGPAYGVDLVERHRQLMKNPAQIRGFWRLQRARYENAAVKDED